MRVLAVERVALRIHAVAPARKLQRAADAAAPADQARDHVAVAVQRRQRRALVGLGAHAALERDVIVEGEEARVVGLFLAPRQRAVHAAARRQRGDGVGDLEQQRIAALPERRDQDQIARLRLRQRLRQHQQRMRGAGVAADGGEVVAHRAFRDAGALGHARRPRAAACTAGRNA